MGARRSCAVALQQQEQVDVRVGVELAATITTDGHQGDVDFRIEQRLVQCPGAREQIVN